MPLYKLCLLFCSLFILLINVSVNAQNKQNSDLDQIKLNAKNQVFTPSHNFSNPTSYPAIEQTQRIQRAGDCWYDLDADFTTLAKLGVEETPLELGNLDDGYWKIPLSFTFYLYGNPYDTLYLNTNGNVTFGSGYTSYSSTGFPDIAGPDMIAAIWQDIDLRSDFTDNGIYYKDDGSKIIIIWNQVGYWNQNYLPNNTFQLILSNGTDPYLGAPNNAQFAYDNMEWAVGDVTGSSGFDPDVAGSLTESFLTQSFATAGAQSEFGDQYYQIGLFGRNNSQYDGPTGDNDGIHYLDDKCFIANLSGTNIPPIADDFPSDTIITCPGSPYSINTSFNSPEPLETTTVTVTNTTLNPASWSTTITDGQYATQHLVLNPTDADVGLHTFTFTAVDDGVPTSETTVKTIVIDISTTGNMAITGSLDYCIGDSTQLFINPGYATYLWGNGEADFEIYVDKPGYQSLTVRSGVCVYTDSVLVVENSLPSPSLVFTAANPLCERDSVILTLDQAYSSYLWNDGSSNDTLVVKTTDRYSVTITDANGCENVTNDTLTFLESPIVEITNDDSPDMCAGEILNLDAGDYADYLWSTGETSQSIDVTTSGTYSVIATSQNGCITNDTLIVTFHDFPILEVAGDTNYCTGSGANLNAGAHFSYLWSNGSTDPSIAATESDNPISITVSDAYGCETSKSGILVLETFIQIPTFYGDTTYCFGGSTTLSVDDIYTSYSWSTGSTDTFTVVSGSDPVTLTVTSANGCDTERTLSSLEFPQLIPEIDGDTAYCEGGSSRLTTTDTYVNYTWSNGENFSIVNLNTSHNPISVSVIDINGCIGTSSDFTLYENMNPMPVLNGSNEFCEGDSATLFADTFDSYLWSTGSTEQTIYPKAADNPIWLEVRDANGCMGRSIDQVVSENPTPIPNLYGSQAYCSNGNAIIAIDPGFASVLWSTGETSNQVQLDESDNPITVSVTSHQGCVGNSATFNVEEKAFLEPVIIADTTYCEGDSALLDAGPTFATYLWSTGETSSSIYIHDTDGAVSVSVTNLNGCTGISDPVSVQEFAFPTATIIGSSDYCEGSRAMLYVDSSDDKIWSNGSIQDTVYVSAQNSPMYVSIENEYGCVTTSTGLNLYERPVPEANITGDPVYCQYDFATLDAGPGFHAYSWPDGSTGQTANLNNTYNPIWLSVSNQYGCSDTSGLINLFELDAPEIEFTSTGPDTVCNNQVFSTTIGVVGSHDSYLWSTGSTDPSITVNSVGTYNITISNGTCPNNDDFIVAYEKTYNPVVLIQGDSAFCLGEVSHLYLDDEYESYVWSSGSFTPSVNVNHAGEYYVDLIDSLGCEYRSKTIEIFVDPMPLANFNFSSPDTIINFLDYSDHANTHLWRFGDGNESNTENPSHSYNSNGEFEVTLIVENACGMDSLTQLVNVKPKELVSINEIESSDITIFPVPSHGWVNLRMKDYSGENYNIEVYNSIGQKVHSQIGNQSYIQMNLSYLDKGAYTLQLTIGDQVFSKKILLN